MQALTLKDLFGVNASQTADKLIIQKSDLSEVGLTPIENNHAEQLVIAILLKALTNFEGSLIDELGNIIVDEASKPIGYSNHQLYELLDVFRWQEYVEMRNAQLHLINTIVVEAYEAN